MPDVTEQTQLEGHVTVPPSLEQAPANAENRLLLVLDAVPALISYVDRDLRFRLANACHERWFGFNLEQIEGRAVQDMFDATTMSSLWPRLQRVLAGETVTFEQDYPTKLNGFRTLQTTYTPDRDRNGEVRGFVMLGTDVTARKLRGHALQVSEELWRNLFERMGEGFFVGELLYNSHGDADNFRFLEINPAFERLTGVPNALGKTVRDAIPGVPEDLIQTSVGAVKRREPTQFEIKVPVLQDRWYEVRVRPTELDRFTALFVDITERKAAEAQLRENERRQAALVSLGDQLRDLRDIPSLASAAMRIVGEALGVNRAGYAVVHADQEQLTVESDWTDGRVDTLAGSYRFSDYGLGLGDRLRNGGFVAISNTSTDPLTARDAARWQALDIAAVINAPLIQNGKLVALLFIQNSTPRLWTEGDLTFVRKVADRTWAAAERARALQELQASEEFTRSILASSPDCIKVITLDGRLLTMNEGGCQQMEITDLSQSLARPWLDFWGETREPAAQAFAAAKNGQTGHFEGFCPTAKGIPKWWEVVVTPIHGTDGKPVRILSISRDITERKRAELERQRLTRELARSNEDLTHFAHIVAHDLQAPLRGIASFAQLLQRQTQTRLQGGEPEFLSQIIQNAQRMQELVAGLLRFAQLGQGDIERKPVDMNVTADAALGSLQVFIDEQEARVIRGDLPCVTGDPVQLAQLLQNLIGNALKYRQAGQPPLIHISATKERGTYVFAVQDNGEGIPAHDCARVFEPLTRLHGSDIPGTGLGLAMCQRIVQRHAGRIWIDSEPGVGSTFYFTLPAT